MLCVLTFLSKFEILKKKKLEIDYFVVVEALVLSVQKKSLISHNIIIRGNRSRLQTRILSLTGNCYHYKLPSISLIQTFRQIILHWPEDILMHHIHVCIIRKDIARKIRSKYKNDHKKVGIPQRPEMARSQNNHCV